MSDRIASTSRAASAAAPDASSPAVGAASKVQDKKQAATATPSPAPAAPPKRLTKEELEKQKKEEAIARKKAQDARFKNRGKRKSDATADLGSAKKQREMSAYEREVEEINKRVGLSDQGAGVRAVTK